MQIVTDWGRYPNFTKKEFDCRETGENAMQDTFMAALQALRTEYGKPMRITSGYRSKNHSLEAKKPKPGYHAKGLACDVACSANEAFEIVRLAIKHGFTGIGVSQAKGKPRFVHLDMRDGLPLIFSY